MAAPFSIPRASGPTLGESLQRRGVSRRALLKYASYLGALMALPASATQAFAEGLANARRQSGEEPRSQQKEERHARTEPIARYWHDGRWAQRSGPYAARERFLARSYSTLATSVFDVARRSLPGTDQKRDRRLPSAGGK